MAQHDLIEFRSFKFVFFLFALNLDNIIESITSLPIAILHSIFSDSSSYYR